MNRPRRLSIVAVGALFLWGASAAWAQESFAERMLVWEAETGQRSRLTLYAKIGTLRLPEMTPGLWQTLEAAARDPFASPLPSGPVMNNLATAFAPAFDLMVAAWGVAGTETFPRTSALDPEPHLEALLRTSLVLCARSQAYAARGDIDLALSDAATVWLAGHSLQMGEPTYTMALLGVRLRGLGLKQTRAILEKSGASFTQEQSEKIARLFLSYPASVREPIAATARREVELMLAQARQQAPEDHSLDIDFARKAILDALEPLAAPQPFSAKADALERYRPRVRGAIDTYPPLRRFPVPNASEAVLREAWADALENVVLTGALTLGARKTLGASVSPQQIASYAGPLAPRLTDPFSGAPLKINNPATGGLMVASPGPDGQFCPPPIWEWEPSSDPGANGDIILWLPWNPWHDRARRGRALQAPGAVVQSGSSPF